MQKWILNFDGTSLLDLSQELETAFDSLTPIELGPSKYLYLGSKLPLSNLYFELASSPTGANVSLEYYTNSGWQPVRYLRDSTDDLSESGHIQFSSFRDKHWYKVSNTNELPELSSYEIYDRYWLRISLDTDATLTAEWLGEKYCTSLDVVREYPGLDRPQVYALFSDTKTTWDNQILIASEILSKDIVYRYSLVSSDQITDPDAFRSACVSRVAALIFKAFGDSGVDDAARALDEYDSRMRAAQPSIDANGDGLPDDSARPTNISFFVR